MSEKLSTAASTDNKEQDGLAPSPDEGVDQSGSNEVDSPEISTGNTITILGKDDVLHQGTVVDIQIDAQGNVEKYVLRSLDQSDEKRYIIAPEAVEAAKDFIEQNKDEFEDSFERRMASESEELKEDASKLAEMLYARSGRVITAKNYTKEQIDESANQYKEKLDSICVDYIESLPENDREQTKIILEQRFAEFKAAYKSEVSRRVTELRAEKLEALGPVRRKMLDGWKKLSQMSRSDKKWKKLAGIGGKMAVFAPIGVVGALLTPIVGGTAAVVGTVAAATAIARGVARFKLDQLSEESEIHESEAVPTSDETEAQETDASETAAHNEPNTIDTEPLIDPESLEKAVQESHDRKKANQKRALLALAVAATAFLGTRLVGEWISGGNNNASASNVDTGNEPQTGGTMPEVGDGEQVDDTNGDGTNATEPAEPAEPAEYPPAGGPDIDGPTDASDGTSAPTDQEAGDDGAEGDTPKLSSAQHEFAKSGAKYPWDAAADVYGRENASDALFKAVKAAKENGLDVKWHGSGENAWLSVKGNSNGGYVIKQLAQYMPKK